MAGIDGDDERVGGRDSGGGPDGEEVEDYAEDEEEEEEDEPRLKYQRLSGNIPEILTEDMASCLCVAEKMIALGTHAGGVHLLDFHGNQVKHFEAHTATVNELCFDKDGEHIASCSDDGTVLISSLYTDEKERISYHRPVKTVAIDPEYSRKKSYQFVAGGLAGQLVLNSRGWLGPRDQVLHSGEGPIHAVTWRAGLLAWANDVGVKVYDMVLHQRISFIDRPRNAPRADVLRPNLIWQDDSTLVIGWADTIKVASIRTRGVSTESADGVSPAPTLGGTAQTTRGAPSGVTRQLTMNSLVGSFSEKVGASAVGALVSTGTAVGVGGDLLGAVSKVTGVAAVVSGGKYVEMLAVFQTDYFISGLAPYGQDLVVLAWVPPPPSQKKATSHGGRAVRDKQAGAQRPEVRIVTWRNEELSSDALSIHGYEHYKGKDYLLAHAPFTGSSSNGGQWAAGDEPLYYIISPKDVVLAKPRDADDHVSWLLQHNRHEKALAAVEATNANTQLADEVGARYLDHLILERRYAEAAALCSKLLRGSAPAWERWVFHFAHLRQLAVLAPFIPIRNPQLRDTVYEVVLNAFMNNPADHERFLETIKVWPRSIYPVDNVMKALQQYIAVNPHSAPLKEALGELYLLNNQYAKALTMYLQAQRPNVFEFIEQHDLVPSVSDKVVYLVRLDMHRAVALLVANRDKIHPADVVAQLQQPLPAQLALRPPSPPSPRPGGFVNNQTAKLPPLPPTSPAGDMAGKDGSLVQRKRANRSPSPLPIGAPPNRADVAQSTTMRHSSKTMTAPPPPAQSDAQLQQEEMKDQRLWSRRAVYTYLDALFNVDPNAGAEFHGLQVELYAEFDQRMLLPFLRASNHYSLDKAYEVCQKRHLTKEMVFILSRMGNSRRALALIIEDLHNMPEAIQFVRSQNDDELWEELIRHSVSSPEMVAQLLEYAVGSIDPLHLVREVPEGMHIPDLRNLLIRIVADYRTETSLRHGCNDILKADCVALLVRYYSEARHGVRIGEDGHTNANEPRRDANGLQPDPNGNGSLNAPTATASSNNLLSHSATFRNQTLHARANWGPGTMGGSGRCCICFDPVSLQDVAIVVFFCTHAYHITCLNERADVSRDGVSSLGSLLGSSGGSVADLDIGVGLSRSLSMQRGGSDGEGSEDSSESRSREQHLRCVLCTTAVAMSKGRDSGKSDSLRNGKSGLGPGKSRLDTSKVTSWGPRKEARATA